MGMPAIVLKFLYPPPLSWFISIMSVISFASLTNGGFMEIKGDNMKYAKFLHGGGSSRPATKTRPKPVVSSKTGMLIVYIPALISGLASFILLPYDEGFRFRMLRFALIIHFFKRVIEVLFIHKYSGGMEIETTTIVSLSYFSSTATMIYTQHLTSGLPEPSVDLKFVGIVIFTIGIVGNFYHHCLLSKLRRNEGDKKQYRIPTGGLFGWVICPHYFFEILGFFGVSCISQTLYAWCFALGTMFYLSGRSFATRRWYNSKFDDFPDNIKALIPYVF